MLEEMKPGESGYSPPPGRVNVVVNGTFEQFRLHDNVFDGQEQAVNELFRLGLRRGPRLTLTEVRRGICDVGARFTSTRTRWLRQPEPSRWIVMIDALADVVYFSVQEYSYMRHEPVLHLVGDCYCDDANVRLSQAYKAALAKYRLPSHASPMEVHLAIRQALPQ